MAHPPWDGVPDSTSVGDDPALLGLVRLAAAVARERDELAALAHLYRAVLELGDLAERIERRIREQVRRRLVEGEGNEHGPTRRAFVGARGERDLPAARGDRHDL